MHRHLPRLIAASAALVLTAGTANAAVVTDFSSFSSATSNLLLSPNTITQTFSTTTGPGATNSVIADAGTGSGAGQALYLSDSFSLTTVGSRISGSLGSFGGTANGSQAIGLAVASSESITSRQNLVLFMLRRNANQELGYITFDAAGAGPTTAITNLGSTSLVFPDSIFIERTATGYKLGSITGVTETIHHTLTIGSGSVTANGTAVGIYSDVRNTNNINTLLNFAHVVPEPGSLALLSLGGLLIARRRRSA